MKKQIKIHGIDIPAEAHTLVTGLPGMGKTRSILRPLLEAYLTRNADCPDTKVGLLLLDPKGDMLSWVSELLRSLARGNDLVVIGEGARGFNLFAQMPLTPMQAALRLSQLGNALSRTSVVREDNEYWRGQQRQMLEALIEIAQLQDLNRPIQVADLCALRFQLLPRLKSSFDQLAAKYQLDRLPEVKAVLKDYANLPNDTRECVLSTVGNCLSAFRQPPLLELMNPARDRHVDLVKIIQEGKCVVVSCSSRSYGDSTLPLLQAVKESFADIILSRPEIQVDHGLGWEPINQSREVLYVADEAHRILRRGDDGGELDFLDMAREYKCRAILATQSMSSLQSVMGVIPANRLVSLCGNHFFLGNIDPPTAEWADRLFKSNRDDSLPPPWLLPHSRRHQAVAWEGPQTLASLTTGEFLFRSRDGNLYRKKARLKNGG